MVRQACVQIVTGVHSGSLKVRQQPMDGELGTKTAVVLCESTPRLLVDQFSGCR